MFKVLMSVYSYGSCLFEVEYEARTLRNGHMPELKKKRVVLPQKKGKSALLSWATAPA